MRFEYEITATEYAAAQVLFHKLSGNRIRLFWAACCILMGVLFLEVAWAARVAGWATLLCVTIGTWWLYTGVMNLFPARYFRRAYRKANLEGKKFHADVNNHGIEVTGELGSWRVQWLGVLHKGEDARVFMFHSQGTIFIFGKKHLSAEQQQELRILSGLASSEGA